MHGGYILMFHARIMFPFDFEPSHKPILIAIVHESWQNNHMKTRSLRYETVQ
jgi:hypothetical protein